MTFPMGGGLAIPVYVVPASELPSYGVMGSAAFPVYGVNPGLGVGQVPSWNGSAFVGVNPVVDAAYEPLPGTLVVYQSAQLASGDNVLSYTVPAGYNLIVPFVILNNPTAGAIVTISYVTRTPEAIDSIFQQSGSVSPGGFVVTKGIILRAGDVFKFNCAAAGVTISFRGYLLPTSHAIKPYWAAITTSGYTTVYTCPADKIAYLLPIPQIGMTSTIVAPSIWLSNQGGSTATFYHHVVPAAGAASDATRLSKQTATTLSTGTINAFAKLTAGQTLVMETNLTAQQACWFTILEVSA